ncbi:MAG: 2-phospho-L-lactate guanylyltransferase [Promethearchaeota archaeon]
MVSNTVAIIPFRTMPAAKHRLAPILDSDSRQNLVLAMLKDVLHAVENANEINRILIVSSEKELLNSILPNEYELFTAKANGLNSELAECTHYIEKQGAGDALIILADLPLLTAKVLDTLIHLGRQHSRPVAAMDWLGTGTNILYLSPPTFLNPKFGVNSLQAHMKAAQRKRTQAICFASLETALDLDNQKSLIHFLQINATIPFTRETSTSKILHQIIG